MRSLGSQARIILQNRPENVDWSNRSLEGWKGGMEEEVVFSMIVAARETVVIPAIAAMTVWESGAASD